MLGDGTDTSTPVAGGITGGNTFTVATTEYSSLAASFLAVLFYWQIYPILELKPYVMQTNKKGMIRQ